ncbi:hypothetical protein LTR99_001768 [Exophiala xenobiotica]|uniref:Uncharacterized protein n=1 Tax=Vermiconidia calcicola TaxID=1690605 RepID=A0AAV9QA59_9PEZI|nr:hypothetical protein LTR92_007406 [Exophiala xenobiotica]KAK5536536.1 hypothetical protein LTR25_005210 [Vermiconidia calcicola]KAK5543323.1 hypothetical protein LTR23_004800 [Chaetothyriales sp. CCFEE 6169]KAK5212126.1 hypothetical protein LTR41_002368 [Exophiala xenobiotica]KAK5225288.1 hypothetical protein LTR47_009541 [Exophiala xenobiotica]
MADSNDNHLDESRPVPGIPFRTSLYPAIRPTQYTDSDFKDKIVLITGSGRGIGRALGLAFCSLGARVCFTDLSPDAAANAAREARETYPAIVVTSIEADMRDYSSLKRLHNHVVATLGEVDILINNAGWGDFTTFDVTRPEDTWDTITVNLKGPLDITRLCLPAMVKRKTGVIICNTTTGAVDNYPFCIPYMLAKTAQGKFMHCLQMELTETDVQCFHVHPGCPKTAMGDPETAMRPYVRELRPTLWKWVEGYLPSLDEDMELAVWSMVFLASGKAAALKGRYINANHDIGEVLKRADAVISRNMYTLKADTFDVVKEQPQVADFYRQNKYLK